MIFRETRGTVEPTGLDSAQLLYGLSACLLANCLTLSLGPSVCKKDFTVRLGKLRQLA